MLYIIGIISDFFLESIFFSSVDLCHTSDTRLYGKYLIVVLFIESNFSWLMWTRSYERHIPYEYIPELRELIERELLYKSSYTSLARIIRDLIEGS